MPIDLFPSVAPRRRASGLFEHLREEITTGRMAAGDRLPPSREIAAELGVSRSTVTTAYGRLVAEGYAAGRVGDGTFVADLSRWHAPFRSSPDVAPAPATRPGRRRPGEGSRRSPRLIDLRGGSPDPALFPVVAWRRSVVSSLQQPPPGYGDPAGLPELRRALAAWLSRSRGVRATPEQIVVTAGAQGAFDLVARSLLRRGDAVAVEDPGYAPARRAFERNGARLLPLRVDDDGADVGSLPRRVRAVYVTPSHQAPSGVTLSAERRRELLRAAHDRDLFVIEDDYDTEHRYVDRPLEPLQRLDDGRRVLYVGSFSKTLAPSLRLGFVVAPAAMIDDLLVVRSSIDLQPPALTQAALVDFIVRGELERHLRRSRRTYRRRRDLVVEHLHRWHEAGLIERADPVSAGLHAAVTLTGRSPAQRLVEQALDHGVVIESTDENWIGRHRPGLVIGFGLADERSLVRALRVLGDLLAARS